MALSKKSDLFADPVKGQRKPTNSSAKISQAHKLNHVVKDHDTKPENHQILYHPCGLTTFFCGFVRCWLVSASGEVYRHSKKSQGLWFNFPKKFFEPPPELTHPAPPSIPVCPDSNRSTATVIGHTERKQQEISPKMSPVPESATSDPTPTQTAPGCTSRL